MTGSAPVPEAALGLDDRLARLAPALLDWAARTDPDCPRLCLVGGARGSGKSRLLAWLLVSSGDGPDSVIHATVPARGQTARTLAWEIGRQLGYGPLDPAPLLERLAADPRPLRMLIPDLHLAGRGPADLPAAGPWPVVADLLLPMLTLPQVRMAIETDRPELLRPDGALMLELPHVAGMVTEPAGPAVAVDAPPLPVDWRLATEEVRETALDRALVEGTAAALLADPGFLVHGSAVAITAALADDRITAPRRLRDVWELAGPVLSTGGLDDRARAAVLHAAALGHDPRLAEFLRPLAGTNTWTAVWSDPGLPAVAATLLGATPVLADPAGRLQRLDPETGGPVARIGTDPRHRAARLAAVTGTCLLAADGAGRLHSLAVGGNATVPAAIERLVLHHNRATLAEPAAAVTALACSPDDRRLVAIADARGGFQLWATGADPSDPAEPRGVLMHESPVSAVAVLSRSDPAGPDLVFTGGMDGTVRLWDSRTGRAMPDPVERRGAVPTALAVTGTDVGAVLAVAWSDRRLHLWQLFEGRLAVVPLLTGADALTLTPDGLLTHAGPRGTTALRLDLRTLWG